MLSRILLDMDALQSCRSVFGLMLAFGDDGSIPQPSGSEVVVYALMPDAYILHLSQECRPNSVVLRHPTLLQLQFGQWNPSDHIVAACWERMGLLPNEVASQTTMQTPPPPSLPFNPRWIAERRRQRHIEASRCGVPLEFAMPAALHPIDKL